MDPGKRKGKQHLQESTESSEQNPVHDDLPPSFDFQTLSGTPHGDQGKGHGKELEKEVDSPGEQIANPEIQTTSPHVVRGKRPGKEHVEEETQSASPHGVKMKSSTVETPRKRKVNPAVEQFLDVESVEAPTCEEPESKKHGVDDSSKKRK